MSESTRVTSGWLCFNRASSEFTDILEYAVKGPLYAASAVLTRRPLSNEKRMLEGRIAVQLPFRKKKEFELRAETNAEGAILWHEEFDVAKKERRIWRMSATGVLTREGASPIATSSIPVQSALGLLFSVMDALGAGAFRGETVFVAGKNLMRLRLESNGRSVRASQSPHVDAEIASLEVTNGEAELMRAKESKSYELQLDWNAKTCTIDSICVSLPIVGKLEARLMRHDRR